MHHFVEYKGFADAGISLFRPLTILIGPNGSGKSNVIEGIELLSFVARGEPLHQIADIGRNGGALEVRGGLHGCPRYGGDSFKLGFSASVKFMGIRENIDYWIKIAVKPSARIDSESLYVGDRLVFETLQQRPSLTSSDIGVKYNNFARGGRKPQRQVSAHRSVLSQYRGFADVSERHRKECDDLVRLILRYLRASFVFDPRPRLMRYYNRIGDDVLSKDGANLSAVLHALTRGGSEEIESLTRLLGWISQLPDEPYAEFDFETTSLGDVMLKLNETGGFPIDVRSLSDGTLRTLAILTALETSEAGSRIVIEEFDNGLHPSRVQIVTQAVRDCCARRGLNVLVTTHNPATLNALEPDQMDGVILCTWDKKAGASSLLQLSELTRADELLERGRLGDLVSRRVVEQYLLPDVENDQREMALEWIRGLQ